MEQETTMSQDLHYLEGIISPLAEFFFREDGAVLGWTQLVSVISTADPLTTGGEGYTS